MKTIITSGAPYIDIDAVACAYAYKDLFNSEGKDSEIIFVGPINGSVPKSVREWGIDVKNKLDNNDGETNFVIVDCSNPGVFPDFVKEDKILEIYDHRFGYQDNWKGKNIKVKIEEVGACATLVWE